MCVFTLEHECEARCGQGVTGLGQCKEGGRVYQHARRTPGFENEKHAGLSL